MTYGLHNYRNKSAFKSYISGYEILFLQAAYQYIFWYNINNDHYDKVLKLYYEGMVDYLGDKSLIDSKF